MSRIVLNISFILFLMPALVNADSVSDDNKTTKKIAWCDRSYSQFTYRKSILVMPDDIRQCALLQKKDAKYSAEILDGQWKHQNLPASISDVVKNYNPEEEAIVENIYVPFYQGVLIGHYQPEYIGKWRFSLKVDALKNNSTGEYVAFLFKASGCVTKLASGVVNKQGYAVLETEAYSH